MRIVLNVIEALDGSTEFGANRSVGGMRVNTVLQGLRSSY